MKAIAYCRKSTDSQDYQYQINLVTERCIKDNIELVQIFNETGSGLKNNRPELLKMKKYIESSTDLDFLVISELSRLGRNYKTRETIELLSSKNIGLISIKEAIVTKKTDGTKDEIQSFILGIINEINGFELNTLKFRTKHGHKEARVQGRASGGVMMPYGYEKTGISKNSKLVICEKEKLMVQDIFNRYTNGDGIKKIVNYLNQSGTKTRSELINPGVIKKWSNPTVYSILKNRIYIGKRKYTNEEIDAPQLRIIEDEQFEKVQIKLRSGFNKSNHNTVYNYILENKKITCGVCGKHYYAIKSKSDSRYVCHSARTVKCENIGVSIFKLERLVQSVILERHSDILQKNLENNSNKEEIEKLEIEVEKLNKELKKELRKYTNLIDLLQEGDIKKDEYKLKRNESENNQNKIQYKINQVKKEIESRLVEYDNIINIRKLTKDFNIKNIQLPKNVVNTIVNNIIVTKIESTHKGVQKLATLVFSKLSILNYIPPIIEFIAPAKLRKNDKLMLITIKSGGYKLYFLMAQQSNYIFDFQDSKIKLIAQSELNIGFNKWSQSVPDAILSVNSLRWLKLK